jgi:hypothetical protein
MTRSRFLGQGHPILYVVDHTTILRRSYSHDYLRRYGLSYEEHCKDITNEQHKRLELASFLDQPEFR